MSGEGEEESLPEGNDLAVKVVEYSKRLLNGEEIPFGEIREGAGHDYAMTLRKYSSTTDEGDLNEEYLVTTPNILRESFNETVENRQRDEKVNMGLSYQELEIDSRNEGIDEQKVIYKQTLEEIRANEESEDELNHGFQ